MALLEKHRTVIYAHFVEHVGEEVAEAMLAQFPSYDVDQLVTKDFLAVQVAHIDADFARVRTEIAEVRTEMSKQTDRLMTRMQILMGAGFGFLSVVLVLTR